jgi:two-component system, OmpR family, sensor kinase
MTIRTRLTLWYCALLTTVIIVFGVSLYKFFDWTWRSQIQENMVFVSEQAFYGIHLDPLTGHISADLPRKPTVPYYSFAVQVILPDGTIYAHDNNTMIPVDAPFDPQFVSARETTWSDITTESDIHALVLTRPVRVDSGQQIGVVQVVSPLTMVDQAIERLVRVMLGVGVVAVALSFVIGSLIAGQALQPIDAISQAAKQITTSDDLSKRIEYSGPRDELGELTETFNTTLERLERLFNAQKRFVADVSHELRTPLTTIQGNLELIQRFGNDPVLAEAAYSESKRMSRLVEDLLMLAQADSGRLPLRETVVDLGSLAVEVYNQAKVLAKEVEIRLGVIEPVRVLGDVDRLKQLMLNLVTNAIKYTPSGGQVTISVMYEEGYAFLRVSDTGMGIPHEDLPHIFDRFYRVDRARARKAGGAGLGLAICRWIAEAHHGRIWAESKIGEGSTFNVQLPSLDAPEVPDALRETRPRISLRRQNTRMV